MKKGIHILIFFFFTIYFISCDQESSYEKVEAIKAVSERISDLNKTIPNIKEIEDKAALVREDNYYLEYEYPIKEDESYVISYRFNAQGCFEIGIDTYFNKESDAQKIKRVIIKELAENPNFSDPTLENDFYKWCSLNDVITLELNIQNIERGTVSLSIFANR